MTEEQPTMVVPNTEDESQHSHEHPQAAESSPLLGRSQTPYFLASKTQKAFIILTAAAASTFSPLSSNIYYPAINDIAHDLQVSPDMMNLTITAYMLFQGLAPSFMGNLSDTAGRRPVYVICFVIYLCANIGLALQRNYWALLGLRALQSTGISATVALSNAVAADVVTSAERGTYLGIASLGGILGPALGPFLGGITSHYWGWYGIFWLLAVLSGAFLIPISLFFPETCRNVVGNGSIPPPPWNRTLFDVFSGYRKRGYIVEAIDCGSMNAQGRKIKLPNPLSSLRLVFDLPGALVLLSNGISYGAYYAVTSSIPAHFAGIYGFDDYQLGLTYIPIGLGTILSSFTNGCVIDWNFRRIANQQGIQQTRRSRQDISGFPIERARLQIAIPAAICAALCIAVYGWVLDYNAPVHVAIIMLFLISYCMTAGYNVLNILIVDLHYEMPGTATASNNLVRCTIGAISTACILPMLETLGKGLGFTLVATMWIGSTPLAVIAYMYGLHWRQRKAYEKQNRDP